MCAFIVATKRLSKKYNALMLLDKVYHTLLSEFVKRIIARVIICIIFLLHLSRRLRLFKKLLEITYST